jgi:hypothetical protein
MKSAIIIFLFLSAHLSFAQIFTIETISKNYGEYAFPLIHSSQRPAIAEKMNSTIQKDLDSESDPNDPFANVSGADDYTFETAGVNERMLCLVITSSRSGAGFHVSRNTYNFDSQTGELIDLNKLFGSNGQAKLRKTLCKHWKEAVKANQNTQPVDQYKACLADAKTTTEIDVNRMLIRGESIKFWAGSCLDGSNYESDRTAGPYELSFGQLLPMLTPYGYSLFSEKTPAAPFNTLLRGTIDGKYPISITLFQGKEGDPSDTIGGTIVYDRVGQPLNVGGKMEGQSIILHELDESSNPLSDIAISWSGTQLSGTFINLKSKKQMSFAASPVIR